MSEIVLAAEKEFEKGKAVFEKETGIVIRRAPLEEEALSRAVKAAGSRVVILGVDRYVGPLYQALGETGKPGLIVRFGVGHDGVDKTIARVKGILVANTPGALDVSVAEHAIWLMGALMRHIPQGDAEFRKGTFGSIRGSEVNGKVMGIVGLGAIGKRVAAMAHFGLGMRVMATGRSSVQELGKRAGKSPKQLLAELGVEKYTSDADEVMREADVVSIHLASVKETRHFIDVRRLGLMKREAVLVNTARGPVVDEGALYEALAGGRIAGAALDVYETEPYVPVEAGKDLRKLSNVVLTPHVGSNTEQSNERMARACVENIRHFLAGETTKMTLV